MALAYHILTSTGRARTASSVAAVGSRTGNMKVVARVLGATLKLADRQGIVTIGDDDGDDFYLTSRLVIWHDDTGAGGNHRVSCRWTRPQEGFAVVNLEYDPDVINAGEWYQIVASYENATGFPTALALFDGGGFSLASGSGGAGNAMIADDEYGYVHVGQEGLFTFEFGVGVRLDAVAILARAGATFEAADLTADPDLLFYWGVPSAAPEATQVAAGAGPDMVFGGILDTDHELVAGEWGDGGEAPQTALVEAVLEAGGWTDTLDSTDPADILAAIQDDDTPDAASEWSPSDDILKVRLADILSADGRDFEYSYGKQITGAGLVIDILVELRPPDGLSVLDDWAHLDVPEGKTPASQDVSALNVSGEHQVWITATVGT